MDMTLIHESITEQGNSIRILATSGEPMEFFVRINGNVRPLRDAIYQMSRTKEFEIRTALFGGLGC